MAILEEILGCFVNRTYIYLRLQLVSRQFPATSKEQYYCVVTLGFILDFFPTLEFELLSFFISIWMPSYS